MEIEAAEVEAWTQRGVDATMRTVLFPPKATSSCDGAVLSSIAVVVAIVTGKHGSIVEAERVG